MTRVKTSLPPSSVPNRNELDGPCKRIPGSRNVGLCDESKGAKIAASVISVMMTPATNVTGLPVNECSHWARRWGRTPSVSANDSATGLVVATINPPPAEPADRYRHREYRPAD